MNNNQKLFCQEYVKNGNNGFKAYMKVYKCKKESTARINASKLLTNANILNYISELQSKIEEKAVAKASDVINELSKIAFINLKDLYDENGNLKEISELDDRIASVISSIKVNIWKNEDKDIEEGIKEVKLWDKMKALELLGKYFGLFKEIEINNNISIDNPYKNLTEEELRKIANDS